MNKTAATLEMPHIGAYFAGLQPLSQLHQSTKVMNISLVASHPSLKQLDAGGFGNPQRETDFVKDLFQSYAHNPAKASHTSFEWIIIDTPPALSMFTRLALAAAHYIVVPARPRLSSISGTLNMFQTLDAMNALIGKPAKIISGLITYWDTDATSRDISLQLEQVFATRKSSLLEPYIPYDVTIEKQIGRRLSKADEAYDKITEEVSTYVNSNPW